MAREFTLAELEAYLDEVLSPADIVELEQQLRQDESLLKRLRTVLGRRDAGVHSLGDIWRRHRISCPDRDVLGSYLLGVLDDAHHEYIQFHIEDVGCRYCLANLHDLQMQHQQVADDAQQRQRRYFQSSAGYLGKK